MENNKFSKQTPCRSVFFIEKLEFSMKTVQNIKFSNGMHYRSVLFIEKLQISRKITNFSENEKIWLKKLKLLSKWWKMTNFSTKLHTIQWYSLKNYSFQRKHLKLWYYEFWYKLTIFLSKQATVQSISVKKYRFYHISLFQQIPRI